MIKVYSLLDYSMIYKIIGVNIDWLYVNDNWLYMIKDNIIYYHVLTNQNNNVFINQSYH